MKKIVIAALAISLSGCVWQTVNRVELIRSEYVCREHQGIASIDSISIGGTRVTCMDGHWQWVDSARYKHDEKTKGINL